MLSRITGPPSQPRIHNGLARIWPIFTTLMMAVLTLEPLRIPGYAALTPALTLMAVYHWTIYRPDLLPPLGLFLIGMAEDMLTGAPIGSGALVLLVARTAVLRYRRHSVNRTFPIIWAGFALLAGTAMLALWLFNCLIQMNFFDLRTTVFRLVLTVTVFPVASFALGRSQRALIEATA